MTVLFWLVLTALIVYAAGYLVREWQMNREHEEDVRRAQERMERRIADLAPLTNNRRRRS